MASLSLCVEQNLVSFYFVHRDDLSGQTIDVVPNHEFEGIRTTTQCGLSCTGNCYMFAFIESESVCKVYTSGDVVLSPIKAINNDPGFIYFIRKDCPETMYKNGDDCLSCSKGTYQNLIGQDRCELCPKGYYQNEAGQTECKLCQNSTNWRYSSNYHRTECMACWRLFNNYCEGDWNQVIQQLNETTDHDCANTCDLIPGCELITWLSDTSVCYLHSSPVYNWGYDSRKSVIMKYC